MADSLPILFRAGLYLILPDSLVSQQDEKERFHIRLMLQRMQSLVVIMQQFSLILQQRMGQVYL